MSKKPIKPAFEVSADQKQAWERRYASDSAAINDGFNANKNLTDLLDMLKDMAGKGYKFKVERNIVPVPVAKDAEPRYAPPVLQVSVTCAPTGMLSRKKSDNLVISYNALGEYKFATTGPAASTETMTTVKNGAVNAVNQWLLDVQTIGKFTCMTDLLQRRTDRAEQSRAVAAQKTHRLSKTI